MPEREGPINLIITGVGGQGTVMAARVLATAAVAAGFKVSVGETFGASQRGGSVTGHLRLHRRQAYAPLIPRGRAGIILGFEPLEALRVLLDYGHPETRVIMNDRPVSPISCLSGEESYPEPERIKTAIKELTPHLETVPAVNLALELGRAAAANMVMLGALAGSGLLPLSRDDFLTGMERVFDPRHHRLNREAFRAGWALAGAEGG